MDNQPDKTLMSYKDATNGLEIALLGGMHEDGSETYDIVVTSVNQVSEVGKVYDNYPEAINNFARFVKDYIISTLTQSVTKTAIYS